MKQMVGQDMSLISGNQGENAWFRTAHEEAPATEEDSPLSGAAVQLWKP